MAAPVFRFAPSPNGELHLGHAYSALLNLKMARETDGKILLRIEDIDITRCTQELEKQMLEDLEWIGFEWDEPPRRQSENLSDYRDALLELERNGLIYPSLMSRAEIRAQIAELESNQTVWPRDPDGSPIYPGNEREKLPIDRPLLESTLGKFNIRLDVETAMLLSGTELNWQESGAGPRGETGETPADPKQWGDVILARKDTPTSYHLACVVDDELQGITHIVRGQDLFYATAIHRLLQYVLDLPEPIYHHHALVLDTGGQKLSKSRHDTSLRQLRESGISVKELKDLIKLP
ncbi:MAG: tRNA glutamyl-Q(34) synthetase GluQRS [Pseudomonadota bacterium]